MAHDYLVHGPHIITNPGILIHILNIIKHIAQRAVFEWNQNSSLPVERSISEIERDIVTPSNVFLFFSICPDLVSECVCKVACDVIAARTKVGLSNNIGLPIVCGMFQYERVQRI
jgi:hypothetical protein